MPECMTHYYFATDALKKLDNKMLEMMNYSDARVFLYANVYDLPYYYRLASLFNSKTYSLGTRLHNNKTKSFIETMIKYIKENGYDKDNVLLLYCLVSHYVLDVTLHPFIQSLAGIYKKDDKSTYIYKDKHGLIERAIDSHMVMQRENLVLAKLNLTKKFKGAFIFNFSDLELLTYAIRENYYFSKSEEYLRLSLKCFKKFLAHTSKDHLGLKRFFFKINDATFNKKGKSTYNFIYRKKYKLGDFLNTSGRVWVNPTTNDASNASFEDLYKIALHSASDYFKAITDYLFYNNSKAFNLLFNDESLDTGNNLGVKAIKYHSSIFAKIEDEKKL